MGVGGGGGWLAEVFLYVHRNRRFIKDVREPRTSTSTFTQLLSSDRCVVFEVLLYVNRNRRLIGDGSPGRPPRLYSNNNDVHLSCAHQRPKRSHDTY